MISEALETLKDLCNDAQKPALLPAPDGSDPSKRHYFNPSTGQVVDVSILPPERTHRVLTLLSLANAVNEYAHEQAHSLWCVLDSVVAVLDDSAESFRRSRVTLQLVPSPLFATLERIGAKPLSQKELYWFLKHDLAQAIIDPAELVTAVETLRFVSNSETTGTVSTVGKNTFGASVMNEVTGKSQLPEEFDLAFDPWPSANLFEHPFSVNVKCSLKTDAENAKLTVAPQPGELDAAKAKALDALCQRVAEICNIPAERVFAGMP